MVKINVKCPHCDDINVVRHGKTPHGVQRYRCLNTDCACNTFLLEYRYNGCKHGIEEIIVDMAANASGVRDTSRVLKVSQDKVISTLKKQRKS
jgi:transposase-like protein